MAYQLHGQAIPQSSGYRLASGIVGIALGTGCSSRSVAKQRDRGRGAPITMISIAGVSLILSFTSFGQFLFTFMFALPIFIVMGIGLTRESRTSWS
jgi:hypothetical protein